MAAPPPSAPSRCRRRIAAVTIAALAAAGALSTAAPAGAAYTHNCDSLKEGYTMWLNRYLTTTNPKTKEQAKDFWIEDFRAGKAMGCTWATGMPMSPT